MAINPQDRYQNLMETRTTPTGKLVYRSLLPKLYTDENSSNVEIYATIATRMDRLAQDFLNSPLNWWKIAAINQSVNGSLFFKPGTSVTLPSK